MSHPRIQEHGRGSAYTCMLWNVRGGRPTVVTIYMEHPDRWIGRRCMVAASSFEPPLEMFMKSDWQRSEPLEQGSAGEAAPAAARAHAGSSAPATPVSAPATPPAGASAPGAGGLIARRGFHPSANPPAPPPPPAPFTGKPSQKGLGFHP